LSAFAPAPPIRRNRKKYSAPNRMSMKISWVMKPTHPLGGFCW
jgi:hypothetical protein